MGIWNKYQNQTGWKKNTTSDGHRGTDASCVG